MIIRWISDVPSKIVTLVELPAVSAGRWPTARALVSTNSAPRLWPARATILAWRATLPRQVLRDALLAILPGQIRPHRGGLAWNPKAVLRSALLRRT
jgi:hypothetical protein